MFNAGEVHATITLSDLLTPQLAKAEKQLESFASDLTGIDAPLAKMGGQLQTQSTQAAKLIENLQLSNKHLSGLTAAYTIGEAAVKSYNTVIAIENALAKANVTATSEQGQAIANLIRQEAGLETALQNQINARHAQSAAIKKSIQEGYELVSGLDKEIANLQGLSAAYDRGEEAVRKYNLEKRIEAELLRIGSSGKDEQAQRIRAQMMQEEALTVQIQNQVAALRSADAANRSYADSMRNVGISVKKAEKDTRDLNIALDKEIRELTGLAAAYQQGAGAVKKYNLELQIEKELTRLGLQQNSQMANTIRAQMTARQSLVEQIDRENAALSRNAKSKTTLFEKLNSLRFGYFALSAAIGLSITSFIDAQRTIERMENTLLAATGSTKLAAQEMSFIRSEAGALGLDLRSTGQEYARFAAATKNTVLEGEQTRKIFHAVAVASTAMGLSAEQSAGALNALQQMVSKTTVQSEELRGQLSERIPGSFKMAADAMGVTEKAFNKMLERGDVMATDMIPKLADAWINKFGPAAEIGADLLNAQINRMKTNIFDMEVAVSEAMNFGPLLASVNELGTALGDLGGGPVLSTLSDITSTLAEMVGLLGSFVDWQVKINELIGDALEMEKEAYALRGDGFISAEDAANIERTSAAIDASTQGLQVMLHPLKFIKELVQAIGDGVDSVKSKWFAWIIDLDGIKKRAAEIKNLMAQGAHGPHTAMSRDEVNAAATDRTKRLTESMQKLIKSSITHYKSGTGAVKEYEGRLAKMLKVATPLVEIEKKLAANMKILNAEFDAGNIKLDDYVEIADGLTQKSDQARISLLKQSQAWKNANKVIADQAAKLKLTDDMLQKIDKSIQDSTESRDKMVASIEGSVREYLAETAAMKKVNDARYEGIDAMIAAERELFIVNELTRLLPQDADKASEAYIRLGKEIEAAAGARFDDGNKDRKIDTMVDEWQKVADIVGEFDENIGGAVSAMSAMAGALAKIKAGAMSAGKSFETWSTAITAGVDLLKSSGLISGPGGGDSNFGGTMSGTYSAEGAVVGAVVGAIIGTMMGGMTAAGAAAGSAIGEMLGSFINKGADEGLIRLQEKTSEYGERFGVVLTGLNNKLGRMMMRVGTEMVDNLNDLITTLGGEISGITGLDMKVRENDVIVFVNGLRRVFKEMDDAISFAMTELLRSAEYVNLDPLFEAALRGNNADNLEQLKGDLEAIQQIINFGFTDSQIAIRGFTNELDVMRNTMIRSVDDLGQLERGFANLAAEEIRRFQTQRDAITGDKKSNAEKLTLLKADAAMWNAEKALRIAELQAKKEFLSVQNELTQAEVKIRATGTDAELQWLRNQGDLLVAQSAMFNGFQAAQIGAVNASLTLLQVQVNAIDQLIAALQAMPDIDIPSLRLPNVGGGRGGGDTGPTDAEREAEEAAQRLADLMKQLSMDLGHAYRAGNQWQTALYDLELAMLEQIAAANGDAEALRQINELYEFQFGQVLADAIDSLGLESESTIDSFTQLAQTLLFLEKHGQLTAEMMRELSAAMFINLADGLLQYVDNEEARMFLEDLRFKMEIANYKLQFQLMKDILKLTAVEVAIIQGLFDQIDAAYAAGELEFQLPQNIDQGNNESYTPAEKKQDQALLNALERLRRALDDYNEFLGSLHTTALGGDTLQQQTDAALAQLMQMIDAAQSGSLDAIEGLPDMAQHFLQLAGQLYDPASSGYQAFVDMIEAAMGGIGLDMQGVLNQVPATMDDAVEELHTIAEILERIANGGLIGGGTGGGGYGGGGDHGSGGYGAWAPGLSYYGPQWGWHPMGWGPPSGSGGVPMPTPPPAPPVPPPPPPPVPDPPKSHVANSLFGNGNMLTTSSGQDIPQLSVLAAKLDAIERKLGRQNDLTETQTDKFVKCVKSTSTFSSSRGYSGPIRNTQQ